MSGTRTVYGLIALLMATGLIVSVAVMTAKIGHTTQEYEKYVSSNVNKEQVKYYHESIESISRLGSALNGELFQRVYVNDLDTPVTGVPVKITLTQLPPEVSDSVVYHSLKMWFEPNAVKILNVTVDPPAVSASINGASVVFEKDVSVRSVTLTVVFEKAGRFKILMNYSSSIGSNSNVVVASFNVKNSYRNISLRGSGDITVRIPVIAKQYSKSIGNVVRDVLVNTYKVDEKSAESVSKVIVDSLLNTEPVDVHYIIAPTIKADAVSSDGRLEIEFYPAYNILYRVPAITVRLAVVNHTAVVKDVGVEDVYVSDYSRPLRFSSVDVAINNNTVCTINSDGAPVSVSSDYHCRLSDDGKIIFSMPVSGGFKEAPVSVTVNGMEDYRTATFPVPIFIGGSKVPVSYITVDPSRAVLEGDVLSGHHSELIGFITSETDTKKIVYDVPVVHSVDKLNDIASAIVSSSDGLLKNRTQVASILRALVSNLNDTIEVIASAELLPSIPDCTRPEVVIRPRIVFNYYVPYARVSFRVSVRELVFDSGDGGTTIAMEPMNVENYGVISTFRKVYSSYTDMKPGTFAGQMTIRAYAIDYVSGNEVKLPRKNVTVDVGEVSGGEFVNDTLVVRYNVSNVLLKSAYVSADVAPMSNVMLNVESEVEADIYRADTGAVVGSINVSPEGITNFNSRCTIGVMLGTSKMDTVNNFGSVPDGSLSAMFDTRGIIRGDIDKVVVVLRNDGQAPMVVNASEWVVKYSPAGGTVINVKIPRYDSYIGGTANVFVISNESIYYALNVSVTGIPRIFAVSPTSPIKIVSAETGISTLVPLTSYAISASAGAYNIYIPVYTNKGAIFSARLYYYDELIASANSASGVINSSPTGDVSVVKMSTNQIAVTLNMNTAGKYRLVITGSRGEYSERITLTFTTINAGLRVTAISTANIVGEPVLIGVRVRKPDGSEVVGNHTVAVRISYEDIKSLELLYNITGRNDIKQILDKGGVAEFNVSSKGNFFNPFGIQLPDSLKDDLNTMEKMYDFVVLAIGGENIMITVGSNDLESSTTVLHAKPLVVRFTSSNTPAENVPSGTTITAIMNISDSVNTDIIARNTRVFLKSENDGRLIEVPYRVNVSGNTITFAVQIPLTIQSGVYDLVAYFSDPKLIVFVNKNTGDNCIMSRVNIVRSLLMTRPMIVVTDDTINIADGITALNRGAIFNVRHDNSTFVGIYTGADYSLNIPYPDITKMVNLPEIYIIVPVYNRSINAIKVSYTVEDAFGNVEYTASSTSPVQEIESNSTSFADVVNSDGFENLLKLAPVSVRVMNMTYVAVKLNYTVFSILGGNDIVEIDLISGSAVTGSVKFNFHPTLYAGSDVDGVVVMLRDFVTKKEIVTTQLMTSNTPYHDKYDVSCQVSVFYSNERIPVNVTSLIKEREFIDVRQKTTSGYTSVFTLFPIVGVVKIEVTTGNGVSYEYRLQILGQKPHTYWSATVRSSISSIDELVKYVEQNKYNILNRAHFTTFTSNNRIVKLYAFSSENTGVVFIAVVMHGDSVETVIPIPFTEIEPGKVTCAEKDRTAVCIVVNDFETDYYDVYVMLKKL